MSDPVVTSVQPLSAIRLASDPDDLIVDDRADDHVDPDSRATRHLCVGVYLDQEFRDNVLRKVYYDTRRRVAPAYGFDTVAVVHHAWRSWQFDMVQQAATAACFAGTLVLGGPLVFVAVICVFALPFAARGTVRIALGMARLRRAVLAEQLRKGLVFSAAKDCAAWGRYTDQKRLFLVALAGCLALTLVPFIGSNMQGASVVEVVTAVARSVVALLIAAAACGLVRQAMLHRVAGSGSVRPARLSRRKKIIDEQQRHPCAVYQRHRSEDELEPLDAFGRKGRIRSPFVGSGRLVHRWLPPITVPLLKSGTGSLREREYASSPFSAYSLVEELRSALEEIATDPGRESIPGLTVQDRLCIAESDVKAERTLLRADLSEFAFRQVVNDHRADAHHFLEVSAPVADGELVATVFIRVSIKGRTLSLDVATCALARTPEEFHEMDPYYERGAGAIVRAIVRSVCALPRDSLRMWCLLGVPVTVVRVLWAQKDRTHFPRRGIGVGPRFALREEVAEKWEDAQLDRITIYDHMKIIEQRLLRTTEDFLETYNVDTSIFKEQAINIINSGVLNMGDGSVNASQSAFGNGGQIHNHQAQGAGE